MEKLVIASANPDKVKNMQAMLADKFEVLHRPTDMPETIEDGETLEFNAAKKAREVSQYTGWAALADDTGLFVDALGGAPGVYSARYAGEDASYDDNLNKMLAELDGVEAARRTARFESVIALVSPGQEAQLFHGVCEGVISIDRTGVEGFGYDPIFIPADGDGRSFAEMTMEDKNKISHRARAIEAFLGSLI